MYQSLTKCNIYCAVRVRAFLHVLVISHHFTGEFHQGLVIPFGGSDVAPRWMFFIGHFTTCASFCVDYTLHQPEKASSWNILESCPNHHIWHILISCINIFQIYYKGDFPDIYESIIIYDQPQISWSQKKLPKIQIRGLRGLRGLGKLGSLWIHDIDDHFFTGLAAATWEIQGDCFSSFQWDCEI